MHCVQCICSYSAMIDANQKFCMSFEVSVVFNETQVHYKCGKISGTVQDGVVVSTDH